MGQKRRESISIEDYRENGEWVKTKTETVGDCYRTRVTRGHQLWSSLNKRCNKEAESRKGRPWYLESENDFKDFQSFVDWCQCQYGYNLRDEKGNLWQIDKDLMFIGNKIYSPDTCLFVPSKINSILLSSRAIRGDYPIGVTFNKRSGKFVAQSNDTGYKRKGLGYFNDPLEAHRVWQTFKMGRLLEESENPIYGEKLMGVLRVKASQINQNLLENKETIIGVNA